MLMKAVKFREVRPNKDDLEKPYQHAYCQKCDRVFTSENACRMHRVKKHGEISTISDMRLNSRSYGGDVRRGKMYIMILCV